MNELIDASHISHKEITDTLSSILAKNEKGTLLLEFLEQDSEVQTLISHGNTLVIGRLNYNDHGPIHSRIASINSLTVLKLLREHNIISTIETEHWADQYDAQVVVLGGAYLHDIGNAIHRNHHNFHACYLSDSILKRILEKLYTGDKMHRIRASILECIYSHDEAYQCLSIEAGCITVGDGTDMANGRARIPFSLGKVDIHSVSALAIQAVQILRGEKKPIRIEIEMTEAAGVFQVQEVLGKKIETSGLSKYIEVVSRVTGSDKGFLDGMKIQ